MCRLRTIAPLILIFTMLYREQKYSNKLYTYSLHLYHTYKNDNMCIDIVVLIFRLFSMPGYHKNFLSSPSHDLKCTICRLIARDPYCSKCLCPPKLYCQTCIGELENGPNSTCPICKQILKTYADSLSARHIRAIKVLCDNKEAGCNWNGQLGELEFHLKSCPKQEVECSFADTGCTVHMMREKEQQHSQESMERHLHLVVWKLKRLEAITIVPPLVFKMPKFKVRKTQNERWYSPSFYSHSGGYRLCLSIDANGNKETKGSHMSVYVRLMKSLTDDEIHWPFRGEVTIEILNQLQDSGHFTKIVVFDWKQSDVRTSEVTNPDACRQGWGYHDFIPHNLLDYNSTTSTHYLKDDTLFIRVVKVTVNDANKPWLTPTITE